MAPLTRETVVAEEYVVRYVQGRLGDAEREAFEDYCVLHPEYAAQVEVDRALHIGLRGLQSNKVRISRTRWRMLALAASILVAVSLGVLLAYRGGSDANALYASVTSLPSRIRPPTAQSFLVVRTRGEAQTMCLASRDEASRLRIVPNQASGSGNYSVILSEREGGEWRERGRLEQVTTTADGTIEVLADLSGVRSDRILISLQGVGALTDSFEIEFACAN